MVRIHFALSWSNWCLYIHNWFVHGQLRNRQTELCAVTACMLLCVPPNVCILTAI